MAGSVSPRPAWTPCQEARVRLFSPTLRGPLVNGTGRDSNPAAQDGTVCISGSADRTVRVWDLGMRRCVHVFEAHQDSVWALAAAGRSCGYTAQGADAAGAGGSLSSVFSGGRDGLVLARRVMRPLRAHKL